MERKHWSDRISAAADLQEECPPRMPLVELYGDRRVLVEHHRGMTEYTRQRITVQVHRGLVTILGDGLELAKMTEHQLIICGCIYGVELKRC